MSCVLDAAAMRKIDPGEAPKLAADEGLLALVVDTNSNIGSVHVRKAGRGPTEGVLDSLPIGRNLQLYALKAGEYEWAEVNIYAGGRRARYTIKDAEYRFQVQAGKLNYSGDLVLRPVSLLRTMMHVSNRSLPVIDWLEAQHPALYAQYGLSYSGRYPDPFPELYRSTRAGNAEPPAKLNAGLEPPKPGTLPISAEMMWKPQRVIDVALNPNGQLLAEILRENDGRYSLDLIDLASGQAQRVSSGKRYIGSLAWESERILMASDEEGGYSVVRVGEATGGKRAAQVLPLLGKGRIVDMLPDEPGKILFEGFDSRDALAVHRVDLTVGDRSILGFQTAASRDRINKGMSNDLGWYADGQGQLRAAVVKRDERVVMVHGRPGQYSEVLELDSEDGFQPLALSFDGNLIYGLSDEGRDQRDLVVFDPASKSIVRTLFSKRGVDVVSPVLNHRREPVAARYYQSGRLVTEYFDEGDRALAATLQAAYPGRTVAVIDRSLDGKQLVLWVDGSDKPPQLYHMDLVAKRASLIDEVYPWLADKRYAPVKLIAAKGSDGLPIEAFLTLPEAPDKRPLVVLPHGGPIGVGDRLHFDREVQYLASLGYAVLQVNFRGSDGYGKAFREAGHRNHGKLIEDDIDAALQVALASYPIDSARLCAVGSSYGGYSALVSAMRWPGRFRCVVSISGVSDRALFFTASDSARSAQTRALMERTIGDPRKDLADMQATSPLYNIDKLKLPIMLVHGRDDLRVDFEHARRLVRMLNLAGRPPVVLAFPNEGHSFDDPLALEIAWSGIAGFLRQNLGDAASAAAGAEAR
ncbi:alpha/beta hydrolase family protein [Lysobacter silvisoli]|nr:prolyl oligopeptidase family serine peptidase [Lysobacter silvisoli]